MLGGREALAEWREERRGMGEGREGGRVPCLRDDDVVEGGVGFAEAGEADFEDHEDGGVFGIGVRLREVRIGSW